MCVHVCVCSGPLVVGLAGEWTPSGVGGGGQLSLQVDCLPGTAARMGVYPTLPLVLHGMYMHMHVTCTCMLTYLYSYSPRVCQETRHQLASGRVIFRLVSFPSKKSSGVGDPSTW